MLAKSKSFPHHVLLSKIVLPILHNPFLDVLPKNTEEYSRPPSPVPVGVQCMTPSRALSILLVILTNADPSPLLMSTLLTPILPSLYAALFYLDGRKTSDPQMKESLRGILETWGRVISLQEVTDVLWSILVDEGGEWELDGEEKLVRAVQ